MLLSMLVSQAPRLLQALQGSPIETFPNVENAISNSIDFGDLESQFTNSYDHISTDLVPDSVNNEVALRNLDDSLKVTNLPASGNSAGFMSDGMNNIRDDYISRINQDTDDEMQSNLKLQALHKLLTNQK